MICERCGGTGSISTSATCPKCGGTGEVITYDKDGNERLEACTNCEYGHIYVDQTCSSCRGIQGAGKQRPPR